ncbi:hypothetical protein Droror1_Dr00015441 [Drosera rotundifolia]
MIKIARFQHHRDSTPTGHHPVFQHLNVQFNCFFTEVVQRMGMNEIGVGVNGGREGRGIEEGFREVEAVEIGVGFFELEVEDWVGFMAVAEHGGMELPEVVEGFGVGDEGGEVVRGVVVRGGSGSGAIGWKAGGGETCLVIGVEVVCLRLWFLWWLLAVEFGVVEFGQWCGF